MKRHHANFQRIGAVLLTMAVLLTFTLPRTGWTASHKEQDRVVVAFRTALNTLDPTYFLGREILIVNWHIFDSYLMRDPKTLQPIPHLVTSWMTDVNYYFPSTTIKIPGFCHGC